MPYYVLTLSKIPGIYLLLKPGSVIQMISDNFFILATNILKLSVSCWMDRIW